MRAITQIKAITLTALLAGTSVAGVKYVAVVETDVDAQSGASVILNPAEVRQVTAELRRVAVENLPRDKYNIMTSETVQSMGGAVLEECADENCVITLGSKIGADYIVRGIISKLGARLTLSVEMYETENGTLVASLDPVRSENVELLVERMAWACGEMYRKFAGQQNLFAPMAQIKTEAEVVARKPEAVKTRKRRLNYYVAPKYQLPVGTPVSWGGVNVEGGMVWKKGLFFGVDIDFGMDYIKGTNGTGQSLLLGGGLNLGSVYDLGNKQQIVYGGSAGFWMTQNGAWWAYSSSERYTYSFLGPFAKLHKNFIEITYRGFLGIKEVHEDSDHYDYVFNYKHQLMAGLYFATSKQPR